MHFFAIHSHAAKTAGAFCFCSCQPATALRKIFLSFLLAVIISAIGYTCPAQQRPAILLQMPASLNAADSNTKIYVASIEVTGNKTTKNYIIEREMRLKRGDSVTASAIYEKLRQSSELIYNTSLFTQVNIQTAFLNATTVSIHVTVIEKWYIYPVPQFQLTDRSFNEWIKTYHANLERVVYGVNFSHYNLSGRRDKLRISISNGFSRNLSFSYTAPYSNGVLTEGFTISAGFTQNRDIIYKTSAENIPLHYHEDDFVRDNFNVNASYIKRKGFYKKHSFNIGFTQMTLSDSINIKYNPAFLNNGKNDVRYPELSYSFQYTNTNNINYPLTGKIYSLSLSKKGLGFSKGVNVTSLDLGYNYFIPHANNWYSTLQAHAKVKAPFNLAYINQRAFGYGDFYLRGLENYVIDGSLALLLSYTLRKKLLSFSIPVPFKNKIASAIPFSIYAKTYTDAGYAYNKQPYDSRLGNRWLYSGGLGLDILTLYDLNFRIEYSFNQLGQKGLFLHAKGGF